MTQGFQVALDISGRSAIEFQWTPQNIQRKLGRWEYQHTTPHLLRQIPSVKIIHVHKNRAQLVSAHFPSWHVYACLIGQGWATFSVLFWLLEFVFDFLCVPFYYFPVGKVFQHSVCHGICRCDFQIFDFIFTDNTHLAVFKRYTLVLC